MDQRVLRAHVAKFYYLLRMICSIFRASKFSLLQLTEIVILRVYYTIPFGVSLFGHFWVSRFLFNCLNNSIWRKSLMRVQFLKWSLLYIKSDLKWCIHLSWSLLLYFIDFVSVTSGRTESLQCRMFYGQQQLICSVFRASKVSVLKLIKMKFCRFTLPSVWRQLVWTRGPLPTSLNTYLNN